MYFKSPAKPGKPGDSLESRDLKGGQPVQALSTVGLRDYVWLPDGRLIYGLAEEKDATTCNYWEMSVDPNSGEPRENPRRLTNWAGFCVDATNSTLDGRRLSRSGSWPPRKALRTWRIWRPTAEGSVSHAFSP